MKVLMVSKALVAATYQSKLAELARLGVELTAVVPPVWIEEGNERHFEPAPGQGYRILVSPLRFNGRFHLHYYPELPDILRAVRPDILHVDEEPYNLATVLAIAAARRQG